MGSKNTDVERPKPVLKAVAIALLLVTPAAAETHVYGSFRIDDAHPTIAVLAGPIAHHTPLDFRRMLDKHPGVEVLGLDSPGGDVSAGLLLALEVHDQGISTNISTGRACYSACAYVFLAGAHRQVEGEIGVHMPHPEEATDGARVLIENDIRFVLAKFDVPIWIYDGILNTPNDQIRTFSAAEAVEIGLNR